MAVNPGFLDHVVEQLNGSEDVSTRKMFGGAGIYLNGKIVGIIVEAELYLKVSEGNMEDYINRGMKQFIPFEDKPMKMPYYEVPSEVLEDRDELQRWAKRSYEAVYGG